MSPSEDKRTVYQRFNAVMKAIEPIAKDREYEGKYSYRSIDDIYNQLKGLMALHGIFALPSVVSIQTEERESRSNRALIYRIVIVDYFVYGIDGDELPRPIRVVSEGMDSGDKATSKAMAGADKISLLQAFKIPTSDPRYTDPRFQEPESMPAKDPAAIPADCYRIGKGAGKPLTEGTAEYLGHYADGVRAGLERGDPWANKEHLGAVINELTNRESARGNNDDSRPKGNDAPEPDDE